MEENPIFPDSNRVDISSPFNTVIILYAVTIVPIFVAYVVADRLLGIDMPDIVGDVIAGAMVVMLGVVILFGFMQDSYGGNRIIAKDGTIRYQRPFKDDLEMKASEISTVKVVREQDQVREISIEHPGGVESFRSLWVLIDHENLGELVELLKRELGEEKVRVEEQ